MVNVGLGYPLFSPNLHIHKIINFFYIEASVTCTVNVTIFVGGTLEFLFLCNV